MADVNERQKDTAFAKFYYDAKQNKAESEKAGRAIYDNVLMVEITKPEDKHYKLVREATAADKARFPLALQHFEATCETPSQGTPLKLIAIFTPADIATLAAGKITTLEKFVGLAADDVPPEFRDLHRQAAKYLDAANDKGALARKYARLEEETECLREEKAQLIEELAKANKELKALKAGEKTETKPKPSQSKAA